ncbi:MAG: transglycosylase SLT domain-containing protein [Gemmatimonadaceae bacterium]
MRGASSVARGAGLTALGARSRLVVTLAALASGLAPGLNIAPEVAAQRKHPRDVDRYDDTFRKYSKRYFGPGFDWRVFKAQGMAESNLDPEARSWVGARGVMQLMPSTYSEIRSKNPDMKAIDDPEWNIAAGIFYDRRLWRLWESDSVQADRLSFTFASYNAGRLTILRAQDTARRVPLDHRTWRSIETVAPRIPRWRHGETLEYIRRIDGALSTLDADGRVLSTPTRPSRP